MAGKVIIMGAAGRDFHNFLTCFRNNPRYEVIGFTAAQIPSIANRCFPPELAGGMYPEGIPIFPEADLPELIRRHRVDLVAFSYSDVAHVEVMHKASEVQAAGADFVLFGAGRTMLPSARPVVSVCGVRTGCGKSPTTRRVCLILQNQGRKVVVARHPMPYGDLRDQVVQRFASRDDFTRCNCTIEELEEYEPLVEQGIIVYAGIDYAQILRRAEQEADVIIWDGGNNDTPFYRPDVHIVLFDPLRPGHERLYHPGETNMLMADIAIINKVNSAAPGDVVAVENNIRRHAPEADIILADSEILVNEPERIRGKRVLVVEDGPTLTHGEMAYGAGFLAAGRFGAAEIIDPKPFAVRSISAALKKYPHIREVLPAMGYGADQMHDLEETINRCECDLVVLATPIHLTRLITIRHPTVRVRYEYHDHGKPNLETVLTGRLAATARRSGKTGDRQGLP
ncbi:MAG: cyclic 2,3-diphosphoglycerate synthase [Desulfobulbaceae bacterium]|nr:cyclic 2,3-diphosphoglycerate synthase [Desulfobulbaceae bacterium]